MIGKPIETDKFSYEDRDLLSERLQEEVAKLKDEFASTQKQL